MITGISGLYLVIPFRYIDENGKKVSRMMFIHKDECKPNVFATDLKQVWDQTEKRMAKLTETEQQERA